MKQMGFKNISEETALKSYRTMIYLHRTSEGNANKLLNNNNGKIEKKVSFTFCF